MATQHAQYDLKKLTSSVRPESHFVMRSKRLLQVYFRSLTQILLESETAKRLFWVYGLVTGFALGVIFCLLVQMATAASWLYPLDLWSEDLAFLVPMTPSYHEYLLRSVANERLEELTRVTEGQDAAVVEGQLTAILTTYLTHGYQLPGAAEQIVKALKVLEKNTPEVRSTVEFRFLYIVLLSDVSPSFLSTQSLQTVPASEILPRYTKVTQTGVFGLFSETSDNDTL